jgi:hypothetical protein
LWQLDVKEKLVTRYPSNAHIGRLDDLLKNMTTLSGEALRWSLTTAALGRHQKKITLAFLLIVLCREK